jgi:hypothetical protein
MSSRKADIDRMIALKRKEQLIYEEFKDLLNLESRYREYEHLKADEIQKAELIKNPPAPHPPSSPSPLSSPAADLSNTIKAELYLKAANEHREFVFIKQMVTSLDLSKIDNFAAKYDTAVANYRSQPAHSGKTIQEVNNYFMNHRDQIRTYEGPAAGVRAPSASQLARQQREYSTQLREMRNDVTASFSATTGSLAAERPRSRAVIDGTKLLNSISNDDVQINQYSIKEDSSWKLQVTTQQTSEATIACEQNKKLTISDLNTGDHAMIDAYIRSIKLMAETSGITTPVKIKVDHLEPGLAIALYEGTKRVRGIEVAPDIKKVENGYQIGEKTHPLNQEHTHHKLGFGEQTQLELPPSLSP